LTAFIVRGQSTRGKGKGKSKGNGSSSSRLQDDRDSEASSNLSNLDIVTTTATAAAARDDILEEYLTKSFANTAKGRNQMRRVKTLRYTGPMCQFLPGSMQWQVATLQKISTNRVAELSPGYLELTHMDSSSALKGITNVAAFPFVFDGHSCFESAATRFSDWKTGEGHWCANSVFVPILQLLVAITAQKEIGTPAFSYTDLRNKCKTPGQFNNIPKNRLTTDEYLKMTRSFDINVERYLQYLESLPPEVDKPRPRPRSNNNRRGRSRGDDDNNDDDNDNDGGNVEGDIGNNLPPPPEYVTDNAAAGLITRMHKFEIFLRPLRRKDDPTSPGGFILYLMQLDPRWDVNQAKTKFFTALKKVNENHGAGGRFSAKCPKGIESDLYDVIKELQTDNSQYLYGGQQIWDAAVDVYKILTDDILKQLAEAGIHQQQRQDDVVMQNVDTGNQQHQQQQQQHPEEEDFDKLGHLYSQHSKRLAVSGRSDILSSSNNNNAINAFYSDNEYDIYSVFNIERAEALCNYYNCEVDDGRISVSLDDETGKFNVEIYATSNPHSQKTNEELLLETEITNLKASVVVDLVDDGQSPTVDEKIESCQRKLEVLKIRRELRNYDFQRTEKLSSIFKMNLDLFSHWYQPNSSSPIPVGIKRTKFPWEEVLRSPMNMTLPLTALNMLRKRQLNYKKRSRSLLEDGDREEPQEVVGKRRKKQGAPSIFYDLGKGGAIMASNAALQSTIAAMGMDIRGLEVNNKYLFKPTKTMTLGQAGNAALKRRLQKLVNQQKGSSLITTTEETNTEEEAALFSKSIMPFRLSEEGQKDDVFLVMEMFQSWRSQVTANIECVHALNFGNLARKWHEHKFSTGEGIGTYDFITFADGLPFATTMECFQNAARYRECACDELFRRASKPDDGVFTKEAILIYGFFFQKLDGLVVSPSGGNSNNNKAQQRQSDEDDDDDDDDDNNDGDTMDIGGVLRRHQLDFSKSFFADCMEFDAEQIRYTFEVLRNWKEFFIIFFGAMDAYRVAYDILHFAYFAQGEKSVGKSFLFLRVLFRLLIDGTMTEYMSSSACAGNTDLSQSNRILFADENVGILNEDANNGNNNGSTSGYSNSSRTNEFKSRITSGRSSRSVCALVDVGGIIKRINELIRTPCIAATFIVANNALTEPAVLSRFYVVPFVSSSAGYQESDGNTITLLDVNTAPKDPAQELKKLELRFAFSTKQCFHFMVEQLIFTGALPDIDISLLNLVSNKVFSYLKEKMGIIADGRDLERLEMLVRQMVITDASNQTFFACIPDKKVITSRNLLALAPYMVVQLHHIIFGMTSVWDQFINPLDPLVTRTAALEAKFDIDQWLLYSEQKQAVEDGIDITYDNDALDAAKEEKEKLQAAAALNNVAGGNIAVNANRRNGAGNSTNTPNTIKRHTISDERKIELTQNVANRSKDPLHRMVLADLLKNCDQKLTVCWRTMMEKTNHHGHQNGNGGIYDGDANNLLVDLNYVKIPAKTEAEFINCVLQGMKEKPSQTMIQEVVKRLKKAKITVPRAVKPVRYGELSNCDLELQYYEEDKQLSILEIESHQNTPNGVRALEYHICVHALKYYKNCDGKDLLLAALKSIEYAGLYPRPKMLTGFVKNYAEAKLETIGIFPNPDIQAFSVRSGSYIPPQTSVRMDINDVVGKALMSQQQQQQRRQQQQQQQQYTTNSRRTSPTASNNNNNNTNQAKSTRVQMDLDDWAVMKHFVDAAIPHVWIFNQGKKQMEMKWLFEHENGDIELRPLPTERNQRLRYYTQLTHASEMKHVHSVHAAQVEEMVYKMNVASAGRRTGTPAVTVEDFNPQEDLMDEVTLMGLKWWTSKTYPEDSIFNPEQNPLMGLHI